MFRVGNASPAPNGGAFCSVTPSGKTISPAMPSASRTSTRRSWFQAPVSASSTPARHCALMSASRKTFSASSVRRFWIGSTWSKGSRYRGSR